MTYADPSSPLIQGKFVQQIAEIMGDKIADGPETTNLSGWAYYWTKNGRRIEIAFSKPDSYYFDKSSGEKKHKESKLSDPHQTHIVVHTEHGDIVENFAGSVKFVDILKHIKSEWNNLVVHPQQTNWVPQSQDGYHSKIAADRQASAEKRLETMKQEQLKELPGFFAAVKYVANHYNLPFTPNADYEKNRFLLPYMERVKPISMETFDTLETFLQSRENVAPLVPQWRQLKAITAAMYDDLRNHADFWLIKSGGEYVFHKAKEILEKQNT